MLAAINRATIAYDGLSGKDINLYNNQSADTTVLRGADLVMSGAQLPTTFYKDTPAHITVEVLNDGPTGASSWEGEAGKWFAVELYTKHADFSPPGLPSGPRDHAGGDL